MEIWLCAPSLAELLSGEDSSARANAGLLVKVLYVRTKRDAPLVVRHSDVSSVFYVTYFSSDKLVVNSQGVNGTLNSKSEHRINRQLSARKQTLWDSILIRFLLGTYIRHTSRTRVYLYFVVALKRFKRRCHR